MNQSAPADSRRRLTVAEATRLMVFGTVMLLGFGALAIYLVRTSHNIGALLCLALALLGVMGIRAGFKEWQEASRRDSENPPCISG